MKKNKYLTFVALAAAALATSCTSDDIAGQQQGQNQSKNQTVTLTASVAQAQTRVGMAKGENNTASFYWHKDDKILVQTVNAESYSGSEFSITGDDAKDGSTSATFEGKVSGTVGGYAVYPYNENHKFTGEKALTYSLPSTYSYTTVGSDIFSNGGGSETTYPANPTNMPMLGTISDTGSDSKSIKFKSLGGLAVIRIDKMPAASGTLTVSANQQLCGDFTVSDVSASDAKIETSISGSDNTTVTFSFKGATANNPGVFYLPLPVCSNYSGVKIVLKSGDVNQTIDYGTLSVARAQVVAIPVVANRVINGHVFVDLGLSVLWAETNVGADNSYDYGSYFAWGETTARTSFAGSDYTYSDNPATLDAEHDAATVNWLSPCRMPTMTETNELCSSDNCNWNWTTENGVKGYKVTSKKTGYTGNSIFLPASGYYSGSSLRSASSYGYCWSSSRNTGQGSTTYAKCFVFGKYYTMEQHKTADKERYNGLPVRAVAARQ